MLKTLIEIRGTKLNNRLVMPPMATAKSAEDGTVSEGLIEYYKERAKGDALGLIITEHSFLDIRGKAGKNQVSISSDDDIPGLKALVEAIHGAGGAKVFAQINHAGSAAKQENTGFRPEAPSPVCHPGAAEAELPEEMTKARIGEIVKAFAAAALRAKAAGYDGVEIHSAHGYLLNQFYSPLSNHRTDEYGGPLENRMRIHREVLTAVRQAVGGDYPIAVRLGGCDYMEGGSTIEDSVAAAKLLERWGADLLDVSGGFCGYRIADGKAPGFFGGMTAAIRKECGIPVILAGNIRTVEDAERLLEEGAADLIGIARPILTDPEWAAAFMAEAR